MQLNHRAKSAWHSKVAVLNKLWDFKILSDLGDSMSKIPRKKVNIEKWIFLNEMWKIIGQIDDFDRFLNNSYNLGVFLAKNQK